MNNIVKLIGTKRLLAGVVLLMVNLILAAFYFLWVSPSSIEAERQLNALTAEISVLQQDIVTIKEQLAETRRNIPYFERLRTIGFYDDQNRFRAERLIQEIQAESGILSAEFAIGSLQDINDENATAAEHRLVMSELSVTGIQSYTDIEIYQLIYFLNNRFPGHTRLKRLDISRANDVNDVNLQKINTPTERVYFADGEALFEWYTMIKDEQEAVPSIDGGTPQ